MDKIEKCVDESGDFKNRVRIPLTKRLELKDYIYYCIYKDNCKYKEENQNKSYCKFDGEWIG